MHPRIGWIQVCRDIALFYRGSPAFAVKAICQFGANVISCHLEIGDRGWYIVGCYLASGDRTTIRDVVA